MGVIETLSLIFYEEGENCLLKISSVATLPTKNPLVGIDRALATWNSDLNRFSLATFSLATFHALDPPACQSSFNHELLDMARRNFLRRQTIQARNLLSIKRGGASFKAAPYAPKTGF